MKTVMEPSRRWMIVDDDADILQVLAKLAARLTTSKIDCFRSPEEALAAFTAATEQFQFVITDLEMPGMNGLEFCRRLHVISPEVKVLLATGSRVFTGAEALQNGFCGLLYKPFPLAAIENALISAGVLAASKNFPAASS
jgi:CheY-like chemotaxis protein